MSLIVIVLCLIIVFLIIYIGFILNQLNSINKQLHKRLSENTRQPLNVGLFNKTIIKLASNINHCLKLEEKRRLDSINEQKQFKELISNISHDLRTPLTSIKGYQQLLQKSELHKEQLHNLQIAQKSTDELGNIKPNLEKINISNLIVECVLSYIGVLEEKNIRINMEEPPPIYVRGDKDMLIRIVDNLLNNCSKHSLGDIDIKIDYDKIPDSKNAKIIFTNPISQNIDINVEKLFHRFYTSDSTRNKSTGLGLSIVEFLVKQLNGDVGAYLDKNTKLLSIYFEIPLFK